LLPSKWPRRAGSRGRKLSALIYGLRLSAALAAWRMSFTSMKRWRGDRLARRSGGVQGLLCRLGQPEIELLGSSGALGSHGCKLGVAARQCQDRYPDRTARPCVTP
jgi:hypothetical protein